MILRANTMAIALVLHCGLVDICDSSDLIVICVFGIFCNFACYFGWTCLRGATRGKGSESNGFG